MRCWTYWTLMWVCPCWAINLWGRKASTRPLWFPPIRGVDMTLFGGHRAGRGKWSFCNLWCNKGWRKHKRRVETGQRDCCWCRRLWKSMSNKEIKVPICLHVLMDPHFAPLAVDTEMGNSLIFVLKLSQYRDWELHFLTDLACNGKWSSKIQNYQQNLKRIMFSHKNTHCFSLTFLSLILF